MTMPTTRMAFFPGCALQSMNWEYRESIAKVASALDLEIIEIEDWTCCGATAAHSLDEKMSLLLPARNLAGAQRLGLDVAVACPMCFKQLCHSRKVLREKRLDSPWSLDSDITVFDLARMLATDSMIDRIRDHARTPLQGLRLVCYYGCQVVRSPRITGYTDYENPLHLDRLVEAVGAVSIDWSYKATCCGASIGIPRKEIGMALTGRLLSQAHASGADAIITCCPLCQNNLDIHQAELLRNKDVKGPPSGIPILYYSELLAVAFDLPSIRSGLKSHMVSPIPLIEKAMRH